MQSVIIEATLALQQGKFKKATQILENQLTKTPNNEDCLALLGHSHLNQGLIAKAVSAFNQLVEIHPHSANAHAELANAYMSSSDIHLAIKHFRTAVTLKPDYSEVWHILGNLLMKRGERNEATNCFRQAEKHDPFRQSILSVGELMNQKKFYEAEKVVRNILKQHPNHTHALFILAKLAEQRDETEQAVQIVQKALAYAPFHISLWQALAKQLSKLGKFSEAINASKTLVEIAPDNHASLITLAVEQANAGKFQDAIDSYKAALKLESDNANTHLLLGHTLKTIGLRRECEKAYEHSISLDSVNGTAYWALADLKSYQFSESQISGMSSLLNDENVSKEQASQAGFALAKHYEDNSQFELAFQHYHRANKLRPNVQFSKDEYHKNCNILKKAFDQQAVKTQALHLKHYPTPIFIVGLTRSGSTLIEQILASHSQIEGTMELYSLPRTVRLAERLCRKRKLNYPAQINELNIDELSHLGKNYLEETAIFRQGKPYFIDKLPPNFHSVGLIHKILPNAIIIDARRHPLSAGFSNYKQHFANGYDFSYDLENTGHYYNGYLDLMDHWNEVLPGKVLCVQYEHMVQDTENQVKCILSHCGLPFEEACLKFYQNKRAVRTASSEQVRQPINKKGMEQWKHFEQFLTPLKKALGENTLNRFAHLIQSS